jgi:hypothetical protein
MPSMADISAAAWVMPSVRQAVAKGGNLFFINGYGQFRMPRLVAFLLAQMLL